MYDRFITIWLENTDYDSAAASPTFQKLAKEGILLDQYHAVTHPSEPNYVAAMAGDFFGMHDDDFYFIPQNVSSLVDLLELKHISWASYQENLPTDGFALDYTQTNYATGSGSYTYYKRKHNPHIILNSVAADARRALRVRNFNDFAVDVNASALPQHVWFTPNMVNDAHDTDVNYVSEWLEYWLVPLLQNPNFNGNKTLIQLTFDENESYGIQNRIYTVLLGNAVPESLKGTTDSTFYTHYSHLSSVQNNWDLPSLGRNDANKTLANVFEFQAKTTNYSNYAPKPEEIPQFNLTGIYPGAANKNQWTPILAPNVNATGAGNGSVYYNASDVDLKLTSATPVNLTAEGAINPLNINPNYTYDPLLIVNKSGIANSSNSSSAKSPASSDVKAAKDKKGSSASAAGVASGLIGAAAVAFAVLA